MDISSTAVVIEDDDDIAMLIRAVLQQVGATVHTAATGAAGIDAVRLHRPRFVTLDLGLPDMDGQEVLRHLRTFSDARILLLSAQTHLITGLHESGVSDIMTKPFSLRELRSRIEAVLEESAAEQAAAVSLPPASPLA